MGTLNFHSYIQTRYPCTTKNLHGSERNQRTMMHSRWHKSDEFKLRNIPQYDGFCLDINSILFANIYSDKKSFSNNEIFEKIAHHIDFLFRTVKPTKFLFVAFDGELPNAKINYLKNKLLAIKDNMCNIDKNNSFLDMTRNEFDTSYFTSGTPFVNELFSYLQHFIAYKISNDSKWQKQQIFINGPEIPGESKVKIAQFIRYYKVHNDNQVVKYCLYTFDPELILLSLSTHEPYISIIQDKTSYFEIKDSTTPEEADFSITHLSLIREYLKDEFSLLFHGNSKSEFDFEKMLDDWILIGILISTHSLPCFSHFNVENGALSSVYNVYFEVLQNLDGYINDFGELVIERLQKFMNKLSEIEMKIFESEDCETLKEENIKCELKITNIDQIFSKSDRENEKQKSELFAKIRNNYYKKFELQNNSNFQLVPTIVSEFIKSIQWNLKYYYEECASWSWAYSYPQAPLVADMQNLTSIDLNYKTQKSHDILDFSLTDASSFNIQSDLSEKKEESNTKRKISLFVYDELKADSLSEQYGFSSFENHADLRFIEIKDMSVSKEDILKKPTNDRVMLDYKNMAGFPSFNSISYKLHFEMKQKGDDPSSLNEVAVLKVPSDTTNSFRAIAKRVLGKSFFVNWPYIQEAYVHSITNFENEMSLKTLFTSFNENNFVDNNLSENEIRKLKEMNANLTKRYDSIGIRLGTTKLLLGVYLKVGNCYSYESWNKIKLRLIYDFQPTLVPYQLLSHQAILLPTVRFKTVHNVFNVSNLCFMIGYPHYGSFGEIKSLMSEDERISIRLNVVNESYDYYKKLFKTNNLYDFNVLKYVDTIRAAEMLDLKPSVLNAICHSIYIIEEKIANGAVKQKKHNVGLNLKYPTNGQEQTLAYVIKRDSLWFFSKLAIELIHNYILEFPEIVELVDKKTIIINKEYNASECLKNPTPLLKRIDKWLRGSKKAIAVVQKDIQKFILDNISSLENISKKKKKLKSQNEEIDTVVSPRDLFKPGTTSGLAAADTKACYDLLDRVICIKENFTVPFGLKGTIINIISSEASSKLHNIYEVIFDTSFPGGLTLYGSTKCKCYKLTVADFINISYGKRNQKNDINDQNEEKVKMKKTIKFINRNERKKEHKILTQTRKKEEKAPKFERDSFDFSVN